uniref:Uncharacterized protein n=1 Tax=Rhizophora mucronata TaxID=61149 RepID=A0A2P2NTH1_RHIMU
MSFYLLKSLYKLYMFLWLGLEYLL